MIERLFNIFGCKCDFNSKGFTVNAALLNPADKFVFANEIAATESVVSPVISSPYSLPGAINFLLKANARKT